MEKKGVKRSTNVFHNDNDENKVDPSCLSKKTRKTRVDSVSADAQHSIIPWPEDLIYELLLRLSWKSLLRFRCVCKGLLGLIDNPLFIKKYLCQLVPPFTVITDKVNRLYSVDFNYEDKLISAEERELDPPFEFDHDRTLCCNGILCLMSKNPERYMLWNPFNNTFQKVKCCNMHKPWDMNSETFVGFGYDHSTDDYKIVRLESVGCTRVRKIDVFSMRSDSWERVEMDFCRGYASGTNNFGICVDDAIHWLWYYGPPCRCIAAFDLRTGEFREISLPPAVYTRRGCCGIGQELKLHDLGGRLCVSYTDFDCSSCTYWVMEEYGVESSWTQLLNFTTKASPIGYFPRWNNNFLCVGTNVSSSIHFRWFNLEDNILTRVKLQRIRRYHDRGIQYICFNSPVRLSSSRGLIDQE